MTEGEAAPKRAAVALIAGALLCAAGIGGAVVVARDDRDTPHAADTDGAVLGIVTEGVPIDEVVLGHSEATATLQHGDEVLIVDGLATTSGAHPADADADPHLRVWMVSASDPTTTTQIDFPGAGPLGFLFAWWWDGEWGIDGVQCPEPWRGDLSDSILADCGTTRFDVLAIDPATATVRNVASDLAGTPPNGGREDLQPVAVNGDTALLRWGPSYELFTLTTDGALIDIGDLERGRGYSVTDVGDSFAALTGTSLGQNGGITTPHAIDDFLSYRHLVGTVWVDELLPPFPTHVLGADPRVHDGELATWYRDPLNQPGELVLRTDGSGAPMWVPLSTDAGPDDPRVQLLDGTATLECDALAEVGENRCRLSVVPLEPPPL